MYDKCPFKELFSNTYLNFLIDLNEYKYLFIKNLSTGLKFQSI
jgi:hypothetical protein